MSNTNIDDLSREDLLKLLQRAQFVKDQQAQRIGALLTENLELMAVLQEMQQPSVANGDEVPTPEEPGDVAS